MAGWWIGTKTTEESYISTSCSSFSLFAWPANCCSVCGGGVGLCAQRLPDVVHLRVLWPAFSFHCATQTRAIQTEKCQPGPSHGGALWHASVGWRRIDVCFAGPGRAGRRGHMTTASTDGRTKRRKMAVAKTSSGRLNEMDVGESVTADVTAAAATRAFVWLSPLNYWLIKNC